VLTDVLADDCSDSNLVKKCLRGDKHSFRQLYHRYQQRVRSTLYQLCGPSTLDDLVQEVFLKAWKGLPKLRNPSQFATWIYRISWNVASDRRKELAQQREQLYQQSDREASTIENRLATNDRAGDLMHLHYQDLVQRGLIQLSLEHRAVLVLHDLEDIPQKDVAQILEIPVGTVKSRLFHARKEMRNFLQKQGVQI